MQVRRLDLPGLGARDLAAWRELAEHAQEPNPFLHPDVALPAARHLEPAALLIAGDWQAALPVRPHRWRRDVLLPGTSTARHLHLFAGEPLVAPGAGPGAVRALAAACRPALALDWVWDDGPAAAALPQALVVDRWERPVVRRRGEADYTEGRLSSSRAKKLRRQARALATELGGELEVADLAGEAAAVQRFLDLEASGWKGRDGSALRCSAAETAFFAEACAALAHRGALQLLALTAGGRTAAMQANFVAGDGLFCFKVAFDEALARHSPGALLELRALEVFHARTELAWMDSCASPGAELLERLWPDRRGLCTLLAPSSRRTRPLVAGGARAAVAVRRAVRPPRGRQGHDGAAASA